MTYWVCFSESGIDMLYTWDCKLAVEYAKANNCRLTYFKRPD